MKKSFLELLDIENKKIKEIEKDMFLNKKGLEFVKEVKNLYKTLDLTHNIELTENLNKITFFEKINKVLKNVDLKMVDVKKYNIDMASQKIIINFQNNQTMEKPVLTINEIIEKYIRIKKEHELYYVIMSFLMNDLSFEVFQLENALN